VARTKEKSERKNSPEVRIFAQVSTLKFAKSTRAAIIPRVLNTEATKLHTLELSKIAGLLEIMGAGDKRIYFGRK
jgi:hypothetical protein